MKRRVALLCGVAVLATAQAPSRQAHRTAYQKWREADPALEINAATAGTALEARTQAVAQAAAAFYAARSEFLSAAQSNPAEQFLTRFTQIPEPTLASGATMQQVLLPSTQNVAGLIATFAGDTDPAIQQLRQALERERSALDALKASVDQRLRGFDSTSAANGAVEQAAAAALADQAGAASIRTSLAEQAGKEAAAWATYYELLAQGARGVTISSTNPAATATPPAGPPVNAPKPLTPKRSITPLPLSRYVGEWQFPPNGVYLGGQPEFVQLTVRETSGHMTGTLYAKFVLPAGSPGDPFVRFDFEGDLQPEREQQFKLRTSEGAGGTIDLIPGSVFNMIEVVFQTEDADNKVRAGNFILLKK